MHRRAIAVIALVLLTFPAIAKIGTVDIAQASTILVPQFEVDLAPGGRNTLIAVQNASATAVMVNVTLWTDYGMPTKRFDIYLTGYDQETIDLRSVFQGMPPITATDGQDWTDDISPQGPFSQDINFASCTGILSGSSQWENTVEPETVVAAHRGEAFADAGGDCVGRDHGDGLLRGFVTLDTVNQCLGGFPTTAGYFAAAYTRQNVLLGDYVVVDGDGRMFAETAVHLESSPDPLPVSFYGAYGDTHVEPLPTAWATTYMNGRTDLDYHRQLDATLSAFPCGSTPAAYPLAQNQARAVSRLGSQIELASDLLPWASGSTAIDDAGAPKIGWIFLNLNSSETIQPSWVRARIRPEGLPETTPFGFAIPAAQIATPFSSEANPMIP